MQRHWFVLIWLFFTPTAWAQTPLYQGKTITVVAGVSAGSAYDLYARLARPAVICRSYSKKRSELNLPSLPAIRAAAKLISPWSVASFTAVHSQFRPITRGSRTLPGVKKLSHEF